MIVVADIKAEIGRILISGQNHTSIEGDRTQGHKIDGYALGGFY
jgi:hypothetical protein